MVAEGRRGEVALVEEGVGSSAGGAPEVMEPFLFGARLGEMLGEILSGEIAEGSELGFLLGEGWLDLRACDDTGCVATFEVPVVVPNV